MILNPRNLVLPLALLCVTTSSMAQATKPPKDNATGSDEVFFNADAREIIPPATTSADKISATSIGNVLSVLLDGAKVSLQAESDPLTGTWMTTIAVPTTGQKRSSYLQQVRGAVLKSEGSRVSLIFSLGGKTFVKEYPYGTKISSDVLLKFVSRFKSGVGQRYVATILIMVERRDAKSAVLVNVDSLDVDAKATKGKRK